MAPKAKNSDERTAEYVYSLPNPYRSGITIDDGPRPMRNQKPAPKHPNGADSFWHEHQAEYDSRCHQPDWISRVENHNSAYPKLKDELDKKHSTARPTVVHAATSFRARPVFDPKCKLCIKQKKEEEAKKKKKQKQPEPKRPAKKNPKGKRSRVSKSGHRRNAPMRYMRIHTNKGCQYFKQSINKGTSPHMNFKFKPPAVMGNNFEGPTETPRTDSQGKTEHVENTSKSDVLSSRNPDTTEPSVTTFNSFLSMEHEPMVSP